MRLLILKSIKKRARHEKSRSARQPWNARYTRIIFGKTLSYAISQRQEGDRHSSHRTIFSCEFHHCPLSQRKVFEALPEDLDRERVPAFISQRGSEEKITDGTGRRIHCGTGYALQETIHPHRT